MTKILGNLFIDGENYFTDSTSNHIVQNNNCTISNTIKAFDNYSVEFNGTNAYLSIPNSTDFQLGLSDFTIDFWVYFVGSATANMHLVEQTDGTNRWQFWRDNTAWRFYCSGTVIDFSITDTSVTASTWYHMALVRKDGVFKIYKNGNLLYTNSSNTDKSLPTITGPLYIGVYRGESLYFRGNLDNIRLIKGNALWDSAFDPNDESYMYYKDPTLISSIYSVGHRGNLRGKAKQGWIRPTIKQFFTSADWEEVFNGYRAKSVVFDINSRYGGTNYGIRTIGFYNKENQIELVDNYTAYQSSTFNSSSYLASFVFNSNSTKIGQAYNNGWASVQTTNPQRLIVVFDDIITFNKMIVNNYHHIGSLSEIGLKNVKITITTDTITSTTPNTSVQNGIVIFDDIFEKHTGINEVQDWEVPLV